MSRVQQRMWEFAHRSNLFVNATLGRKIYEDLVQDREFEVGALDLLLIEWLERDNSLTEANQDKLSNRPVLEILLKVLITPHLDNMGRMKENRPLLKALDHREDNLKLAYLDPIMEMVEKEGSKLIIFSRVIRS